MNREKELVKELIACVSRNPRIDGGFAVKRDLENSEGRNPNISPRIVPPPAATSVVETRTRDRSENI